MAAQTDEVRQVARRRYWRATDARVVVEAWQRSGERAAVFARRYDLDPQRIARWASEFRSEAPQPQVQFHPVRILDRGAGQLLAAPVIEIVLTSGERVRVPPGVDPVELRQVLDVLGGAQPC